MFDRRKTGEFISRLQGDVAVLANIVTDQAINIIINIMKVLIIGTVIFRINTILAFIVLSIFPVTYFIFFVSGKKLRKENKALKEMNDKYFSIVQQSLLGIKHIKTYGIKGSVLSFFYMTSVEMKKKEIYISLIQIISQVFSKIISSLNDILVIGISIYFISKGRLSIKYFVAFVAYSGQFNYSLMTVTRLNSSIQQVLVSLERIFGLVDNLEFSAETFGDEEIQKAKGNIEFKNVTFTYNGEREILRDVSFSLKPNSLTAIVGKNGCGKTTILNLLLGLYKVTDGEILIDGININDLNEKSLRNNISVVNQENFLFNLSIKDNLKLSLPSATIEQIEMTCKQVFIHDYIMSLEKNYDTIIDENGSNLSGGQKQRLALAMCILRNSPIILLDEATSALDVESKNIVNAVIGNIAKFKTVILITHHISSIMIVDEIIIMDEGKKVGQGSHEELINNNLQYINLYKNEFIAFREISAGFFDNDIQV
jgi:ATP-binding cassette subfamily B protein